MGKIKRGRYDCMGRECNDCGRFKLWKEFGKNGKDDSPNRRRSYCKDCSKLKRKPRTKEQRERKQLLKKERRLRNIQKAINLAGGNINVNNGFIYLYRCDELDCFKIGKTKANPFDYISTKSRDYGLDLKMVAYIVSPVRDYDAEWLATKDLKHKKIKHTKPCGGVAHELFRCGLHEAVNILRGISDKMYLEPNPFITLEDLNAVEIVEHIPTKEERYHKSREFSGVVARRILRETRNSKQWNVDCGDYVSTCECRQLKFDRGVGLKKETGEAYMKFKGKKVYLGMHGFNKDVIVNKFKSVYDMRDSLFINGRYIEGAEDLIRMEVEKLRKS